MIFDVGVYHSQCLVSGQCLPDLQRPLFPPPISGGLIEAYPLPKLATVDLEFPPPISGGLIEAGQLQPVHHLEVTFPPPISGGLIEASIRHALSVRSANFRRRLAAASLKRVSLGWLIAAVWAISAAD